jgi:hypothetical protein
MRATPILNAILLLAPPAMAQKGAVEIAPFVGGYFSNGSEARVTAETIRPNFTLRQIQAMDEANGGIFGVRGRFGISPRLSLEGAFAFSPVGRHLQEQSTWVFSEAPQFLPPESSIQPVPVFTLRGSNAFSYSGNLSYDLLNRTWGTLFTTGGLGAITRTGEVAATIPLEPRIVPFVLDTPPFPGTSSSPPTFPTIFQIPADETDLAMNFGVGVRIPISDTWGLRLDMRNYLSRPDSDTVNNLESSLGIVWRVR